VRTKPWIGWAATIHYLYRVPHCLACRYKIFRCGQINFFVYLTWDFENTFYGPIGITPSSEYALLSQIVSYCVWWPVCVADIVSWKLFLVVLSSFIDSFGMTEKIFRHSYASWLKTCSVVLKVLNIVFMLVLWNRRPMVLPFFPKYINVSHFCIYCCLDWLLYYAHILF
jgi:hypothetical protein